MNQSLQPGSEPLGDSKPPVMFKYLQQALGARHKLEGRNHRELTTLALACDAILQGQLEKGLDILSQRFKRVEAQAVGSLPPDVAERLEIIPDAEVSALSLEEREEATALSSRWQRYLDKRQNRSRSRTNH